MTIPKYLPDGEPLEATGPLLKGYRELSPFEAALANEVKTLAEHVGHTVEKLRRSADLDQRWVATGATDRQKGFMALVRAITRPTTF